MNNNIETPRTFASEQVTNSFTQDTVEPTELERLVQRTENYTIPFKPNTTQAILGVVTRGLQKGMFAIEDLDAVITIREEVNKGLIDYQTTMKHAQEQLVVLQQQEFAKKEEATAKYQQDQRAKITEERTLRKQSDNRLAQMEAVLLKAGISIDLDGDGIIGLPTGQVTDTLTASEQQEVDNIVSNRTIVPTPPTPSKPTSSAFKMARMMNPVVEPIIAPQSEETITLDASVQPPVGVDLTPISENEQFVEQVAAAKKSFAEFVEEPVNEDAIITGASTEEFFDEVERVEENAEVPVTIPTPQPSFVTGGNAPNITGIVGNTPNITAPVEEVSVEDQETMNAIDEQQFNESFEEEPTLDVGYEQPILGENDVVIKQDQIKTIENYEDMVAEEEEFEEVVIPNRSDLEGMTKAQIEVSANKLSFTVDSKLTKTEMISEYETQANELIESLTGGDEFVSATEEDLNNGDEDRRDGGYF